VVCGDLNIKKREQDDFSMQVVKSKVNSCCVEDIIECAIVAVRHVTLLLASSYVVSRAAMLRNVLPGPRVSRTDTERVQLGRPPRRTAKETLCKQRYQGVLWSMGAGIAGTTAAKPKALALGVAPDCVVKGANRALDVMQYLGVMDTIAVQPPLPGPTCTTPSIFGKETIVGGEDVILCMNVN
jgi:hypothetical protein